MHIKSFIKYFLEILFIFREIGREEEREGELSMCKRNTDQLPPTHSQWGPGPHPRLVP